MNLCTCFEDGLFDIGTGLATPKNYPEQVCSHCEEHNARAAENVERRNALYDKIQKENRGWCNKQVVIEMERRLKL